MNYQDLQQWFKDDGDNTLRVNYNLNEDSIVFDLGGYHGEWTNKIYEKYKCNVYVFEPIPDLYQRIKERFSSNEKIKVFNFGISDESKELLLTLDNDGSSFYTNGSDKINAKVISIIDILNELNIKNIDLIKINIEGDEFPVLKKLLDANMINIFNNIQVQFHQYIQNSVELRNEIRERLSKTHKLTYDYEFVWENWEKYEI